MEIEREKQTQKVKACYSIDGKRAVFIGKAQDIINYITSIS